ncbi:MAG: aldehyde ferredoxin oxidoreductase family protein [Thermoprotei archaeon]
MSIVVSGMINGYNDRILIVDLDERSSKVKSIDRSIAKMFIGGKGLANYFLYEYNIWNYDAYSPNNLLVFATGPFGGLPLTMATRAWVAFKSPLTNILGGSNLGGTLGAVMKYAGVDMLVVKGASKDPVYLIVRDERVDFKDASHLWSKDAIKCEEILWKDHGKDSAVLAIGPAGENLVRYASINHDRWRQFGRTGPGAVMGSKKLKAIVFQPADKSVSVADPNGFSEYLKRFNLRLSTDGSIKSLREGGTPRLVEVANGMGFFPSYYWSKVYIENWQKIAWPNLRSNYFLHPAACLYCSAACHRLVESRKFDVKVDIEYETIFALGSNLGIVDPDSIIVFNDLADRLGMDTISLGNTIGFAIELSKKGKLELKIDWDNTEAVKKLIVDIAYRKGVGDLLADGVAIAARRLDAENLAVHVKGLEPAAYDPRSLKGMALNYAIAGRGADHLGTMAYALDIAGKAGGKDSLGEEKVRAIINYENLSALMDSLLLCKFGRYVYDFQVITDLLNLVTGFNYNVNEVIKAGERIITLTRLINVKMGVNKVKDQLPRKWFEPIEFENKKYVITKDEFENALSVYYKLRGWDENGIPKPEKLAELNIITQ